MSSNERYLYTAHSRLTPKPGHEDAAHRFVAVVDRAIGRTGGNLGPRWVDVPTIEHVLALRRQPGNYRFEFIASARLGAADLRTLELTFTAMDHGAPCDAQFQWDLNASDPSLHDTLRIGRSVLARQPIAPMH